MTQRDRGRVQYADLVVGFASLVAFVAMANWMYSIVNDAAAVADPLSATLLQIALPMFVVALIISLGVSARTG